MTNESDEGKATTIDFRNDDISMEDVIGELQATLAGKELEIAALKAKLKKVTANRDNVLSFFDGLAQMGSTQTLPENFDEIIQPELFENNPADDAV
jgi:uncharacterized small protein (DUF1192 family)